jgi:hypothetical protein
VAGYSDQVNFRLNHLPAFSQILVNSLKAGLVSFVREGHKLGGPVALRGVGQEIGQPFFGEPVIPLDLMACPPDAFWINLSYGGFLACGSK